MTEAPEDDAAVVAYEAGRPLSDVMTMVLDELEAVAQRDGKYPISTGLADLDSALTGIRPGLVHVLFGEAGAGASILALQIARNAVARHGAPTLFFSGQSPEFEIVQRVLSAETEVPLFAMRAGLMDDDRWTRVATRMAEIAELPLFIEAGNRLTPADLRSMCETAVRDHGVRLVVIDGAYLYAPDPGAPEHLGAAHAILAAEIRHIAQELNVPFVLTTPTNRRARQRTNPRPCLEDVAPSPAYAREADIVIGVYRETQFDRFSPRRDEADLVILANRFGPVCTATVTFDGNLCRFVDLAEQEAPPLPDGPK